MKGGPVLRSQVLPSGKARQEKMRADISRFWRSFGVQIFSEIFHEKNLTRTGKKNIYLLITMLIEPDTGNPMIPRIFFLLLLLVCILCTAGCTLPSAADNLTANTSDTPAPASIAKYQLTLAQPEDSAKLVKMDTDVYNLGEVVEFVVTNEKNHDLSCSNNPPSFSVRYQKGNGQWVARMGKENPVPGNTTKLKPGESTSPYRFVTDGWAPGRYRIVTDCGVSREILLRALPSVTPVVTTCIPSGNTSPYVRVNPVSSKYVGESFSIDGTTSLPAGEELGYSIFAILPGTTNITAAKLVSSTTTISAGSCGTNTWNVEGVIAIPGDYFIGISNRAHTVSAVKRFTVLAKGSPMVTITPPEKTTAPGITTG